MASDSAKELLADVAYELAEMGASNHSWQGKDIVAVLERRLLDLIAAGEGMHEYIADQHGGHQLNQVELILIERWRAAKAVASEGKKRG